MSVIHKTTITPTKLELLAAWLPSQPWYAATGSAPEPAKAGGFRLDDPEGEVGIEFMVVADASAPEPVAYHVPMTYRGAPLEGAEGALIGTVEHGVLGTRWVYDAAHDPVAVGQVLALLRGEAQPWAQSVDGAPDPTVAVEGGPVAAEGLDAAAAAAATTAEGTEVRFGGGQGVLRVVRVLRPGGPGAGAAGVVTGWTAADGTAHRGVFAALDGA
ncbi:maltokinase N-terminal cap-like domain-containing protein [Streptomyces toxytricini]|uniref:maltokinase N-terminal cap-like domain-containing protein n=1 Tax=Streptomyces toxytricini TaxID=67369 RepID=UPI00344182FE